MESSMYVPMLLLYFYLLCMQCLLTTYLSTYWGNMKKYIEDFTPMRRGSIISRNPISPYSCWTTAHSRQVAAASHMYTKTIHFKRKTVIQQCHLQIVLTVAVPQWKYPLPHRDDTRSYEVGSQGSSWSSPSHTILQFTSSPWYQIIQGRLAW